MVHVVSSRTPDIWPPKRRIATLFTSTPLRTEQPALEDRAGFRLAAGLTEEKVVVDEAARARGRDARRIGGGVTGAGSGERLRGQQQRHALRRIVESHLRAQLGTDAIVALAVHLHHAARRRLDAQLLQVGCAQQQRAVRVATHDERHRLRLVVDAQLDDDIDERLVAGSAGEGGGEREADGEREFRTHAAYCAIGSSAVNSPASVRPRNW